MQEASVQRLVINSHLFYGLSQKLPLWNWAAITLSNTRWELWLHSSPEQMEVDVYAASWSEVQWYYFLQLQLSTVLVGHSVIHKELKREHE